LTNAQAFSSFDFVEKYREICSDLFLDARKNVEPLYGKVMIQTLLDSIKKSHRIVYNSGYKDGQKNILNGMTYKIGHILMWLPVKLKRLLFKDE